MLFHNSDTAVFTRAEAKALAAHADKDETRPNLNCVCVDFANGSAIATDGHRLAKSNSAACFAGAEQCLIPLAAWERAIKACSKKTHGILLRRNGRDVTLTAIDPGPFSLAIFGGPEGPEGSGEAQFAVATITAVSPDAKFPPYQQVIPEHAAARFGMNMRYLGDVQLCAIAAGTVGAELHPAPDPLDPLVALCNGPEGSWTVVVMPMRI